MRAIDTAAKEQHPMFNFKTLTKFKADFDEQVAALDRKVSDLERERQSIGMAAVNRTDLKASAQACVRQSGETYVTATRGRVAALAWLPGDVSSPRRVGLLGKPADQTLTAGEVESLLCALFPREVSAALSAAVDQCEWPDKEGLPSAQRQAELQRLDAEIGARRAELSALVEQARQAGLDV